MEERDKVGYEQAGPLPPKLLSSRGALCRTGDLCSAPGPGQQMRSFSGSSQKLKTKFQLPHTFSNTFLTNVLVE